MNKHIIKITSVCFYHLQRLNEVYSDMLQKLQLDWFLLHTQPAELLQYHPDQPTAVDDCAPATTTQTALTQGTDIMTPTSTRPICLNFEPLTM